MMPRKLFAGIVNAHVEDDETSLPDGMVLSREHVGLFGGFFAHADRLTPDHPFPNRIHPVKVDIGYEITTQLSIPALSADGQDVEQLDQLRLCLFLLRLICAPEIHAPVYSSVPLADVAGRSEGPLHPFELLRHSPFRSQNGLATVTTRHTDWLGSNWERAHTLFDTEPRFRLALQAFDRSIAGGDLGLFMLGLWSGLEALFSPSDRGELRFRLAATIGVYLEPPGKQREALWRRTRKLYDVRSKITHGGRVKDFEQQVVETYEILQKTLIRCVERGKIPDPSELTRDLLTGT